MTLHQAILEAIKNQGLGEVGAEAQQPLAQVQDHNRNKGLHLDYLLGDILKEDLSHLKEEQDIETSEVHPHIFKIDQVIITTEIIPLTMGGVLLPIIVNLLTEEVPLLIIGDLHPIMMILTIKEAIQEGLLTALQEGLLTALQEDLLIALQEDLLTIILESILRVQATNLIQIKTLLNIITNMMIEEKIPPHLKRALMLVE